MKKKVSLMLLAPICFTFLFMILALTGFTNVLEFRIFDSFLKFRPSPPEDSSIMLIDIDDQAVSTIGTWPISRSITGDGLMLLAEMGARQAVFDIEYTDKSPRGVNSEVIETVIPELLESNIGQLQYNISSLFEAVSAGYIPVEEASEYIEDLVDLAENTKEKIIEAFVNVAVDNDIYLGQAARFFGNAWFTINMRTTIEDNVPLGLREFAIDYASLKNITNNGIKTKARADIVPVIMPIFQQSAGAGFTNADADSDGIRRRIFLVHSYKDNWFGQLVFRPLLHEFGNPEVELYPRKIIVKNAQIKDKQKTLTIPISSEGAVLLDWPHKNYNDSFKHISFYFVYMHDQLFDDLIHNVQIGISRNYFYGIEEADQIINLDTQARNLKKAIMNGEEPQEKVGEYRLLRDHCLAQVNALLGLQLDTGLLEYVTAILQDPDLDNDIADQYQLFKTEIPVFFDSTTGIFENLTAIRENRLAGLDGSFCIIGQTNTGSTDLGANPFETAYPNIGTHASLVNMLINGKFILELSPLWSVLISLFVGLLLVIGSQNMHPSKATALGIGVGVGIIVIAILFFVATGKYLAMIPLAGPVLLSFISVSFIRFFGAEKEKGFLRSAFSHYLSAEVIKQIIANPDKLKLGGEERGMTAIFTDIQGFSTLAENMRPVELVAMLNRYLTGMSDIVLELGGTIDKYEGDAIIAFFGAPLDMEDHAKKAILAAVRMKRKEKELNQQFLGENILTMPIKTRIGINTGQMVVGNMGTDKKMDYTIIGDSVNLAARLEGVNKRYGTYVCVSEYTKDAAGDSFIYRRLDRIRVVGKAIPIRIFEVVEEKGILDTNTEEALLAYETGQTFFEEKKWKKALVYFERALKLNPEDGPSLRFIATCNEYIKNPPPENWDGVYRMDQK